jgi:hypothetical protein
LPDLHRIDTLTSNWAVQVKYKSSGAYQLSDFTGSAAGGEAYLDQMVTQATQAGRIPVLVTNRPIGVNLQNALDARNIEWQRIDP